MEGLIISREMTHMRYAVAPFIMYSSDSFAISTCVLLLTDAVSWSGSLRFGGIGTLYYIQIIRSSYKDADVRKLQRASEKRFGSSVRGNVSKYILDFLLIPIS